MRNYISDGEIIDFTSMNAVRAGEISGYRQIFGDSLGFFIDDGLTLNDDISGGITLRNSIVLNFPAGAVFLKEGTNLTIGTIRSNINFNSVQSDSVFCDFVESNITNDAGLNLTDFVTSADNPIPNISEGSVKTRFRNCTGLRNTYVGGQYRITNEAVTETPGVNQAVKIADFTVEDKGLVSISERPS